MSIRPLDMQVIVPKSSEVLKLNNNLISRQDESYQNFSDIMEKQTDIKQKQVLESNKSENTNIKNDKNDKNNSKNSNSKKNFKKNKIKESSNKNNKQSTSIYDISI